MSISFTDFTYYFLPLIFSVFDVIFLSTIKVSLQITHSFFFTLIFRFLSCSSRLPHFIYFLFLSLSVISYSLLPLSLSHTTFFLFMLTFWISSFLCAIKVLQHITHYFFFSFIVSFFLFIIQVTTYNFFPFSCPHFQFHLSFFHQDCLVLLFSFVSLFLISFFFLSSRFSRNISIQFVILWLSFPWWPNRVHVIIFPLLFF